MMTPGFKGLNLHHTAVKATTKQHNSVHIVYFLHCWSTSIFRVLTVRTLLLIRIMTDLRYRKRYPHFLEIH